MRPRPSTAERRVLRFSGGVGLGWIVALLVIPLVAMLGTSFFSRGPYGEITRPLTLDNFKRIAGFGFFGFDPVYPFILLRSVLLAGATTFLCALLALPVGFSIARLRGNARSAGLTLLVIPLWTNLLIRTYAWQIILGSNGFLAGAATAIGLTRPGEGLYPGYLAVYACLLCDYLPYITLPLYASIEKLDWTLADAAMDLGAGPWKTFRHALLPQLKPGLIAGSLMVFLPALGQFVIPDLLGGAKTVLLGNILQQQFGPSRDWPFGSAVAAVALLLVMAALWVYTRNEPGDGLATAQPAGQPERAT